MKAQTRLARDTLLIQRNYWHQIISAAPLGFQSNSRVFAKVFSSSSGGAPALMMASCLVRVWWMLSDEGFSRAWCWLAVGFHMCVSSSLLGSAWVPAVAERSEKGMIMGVGAWLVALNWNLFSAARDLVGLLRWWLVWVIGLMAAMVVSWRREASRRGFFRYFFRVLFLGFWLGLISPYSLELGFGFIVGPWLWRYSWGQFVSNSVCFCRQFADIRSLHVVWYVLERGVEEGVVFLAVVYEVLSGLSGLFFISSLCGRFMYCGSRLSLFSSFGLFLTISM